MYSPPIKDMAIATAEHFIKNRPANNARDAIAAWKEYVEYHNLYNPCSSIGSDEKCKYWFILGATITRLSEPLASQDNNKNY